MLGSDHLVVHQLQASSEGLRHDIYSAVHAVGRTSFIIIRVLCLLDRQSKRDNAGADLVFWHNSIWIRSLPFSTEFYARSSLAFLLTVRLNIMRIQSYI